MTHVTCRLTAKNRDQLRNPTLGNRVWATFTFVIEFSALCALEIRLLFLTIKNRGFILRQPVFTTLCGPIHGCRSGTLAYQFLPMTSWSHNIVTLSCFLTPWLYWSFLFDKTNDWLVLWSSDAGCLSSSVVDMQMRSSVIGCFRDAGIAETRSNSSKDSLPVNWREPSHQSVCPSIYWHLAAPAARLQLYTTTQIHHSCGKLFKQLQISENSWIWWSFHALRPKALYKCDCYYYFLTPVLNSQGMKKYAMQ